MDAEQLIGTFHDVPEGDAFMQDDSHCSTFGSGFGDTSSIMTML